MNPRSLALFGAALCSIALPAASTHAQTETTKPAAQTKPAARQPARPASNAAADPLAEVRRSMAISSVLTLAEEARGFRDGTLAARVQMRAADALWEADNERARELFRRAWDAAEAADREALRRQEEERRKQQQETGTYALFSAPNLRAEVLRLSARRDRSLGEEFLAKLDEARKRDAEATATKDDPVPSRSDPQRPSRAQTERLQLARNLLSDDVERAVQFADPALTSVTMQGLYFLSSLRQKNTKLADDRYAAMLSRAAVDPASDANTVSLLASYLFTPSLFVTVDPGGGVNSSRFNDDDTAPTDIAPAMRTAYLNAAAQIMLRPLPQPQQDTSSSGRGGLYFMIARLLPLFDQYLPQRSPALRAQMAALAQDVSDDLRQGRNQWLKEGLVPESEGSNDEEKDALDIANSEADPAKRNRAYARAALAAARRGDARARDYADKIDATNMRKSARAYVDYELVNAALGRKDAQEAARLARTGELTKIQLIWAYTESAGLLAKANPSRAVELLEEALQEANRIGASDAEHARALVAIATRMYQVNAGRGWEIMSDAVRASNSAEGFTGEDGRVNAQFAIPDSVSMSSSSVPSFDLAGIFGSLARDDFNRALQLAKEFKTEAPRAAATLAVARAVLTERRR